MKTLGTCQVCGREQAVLKTGRMAKHGYTVENGWFNGVCAGEHFVPLEVSREETDRLVADIREQVIRLLAYADAMERGDVDPEHAYRIERQGYKAIAVPYPFCEASQYDQDQQRWKEVARLRSRAEMGQRHADMMAAMADRVHGKPLRKVEVAGKAAPIKAGEQKRLPSGLVATATGQKASRVYWTTVKEGREVRSWTGTAAWRKLPDA